MKYINICKALYDYTPQADDELEIREDDVLYILENDDPEWLKAQLKSTSVDEIGPIGIVPANYVDEAEPIGSVKALYDYEAQQEEELNFAEDDILVLYENDDPDWFLVKSRDGQIGLVPSNYVETIVASPPEPATLPTPSLAGHESVAEITPGVSSASGEWAVQEYDPVKKKKTKNKGNLFIANGLLCYGSSTDKALPVQQYPLQDVTQCSLDGKLIHIALIDGTLYDFQLASKTDAKAIHTILDSVTPAPNVPTIIEPVHHDAAIPTPPPLPAHATSPAPAAPATTAVDEPACEPRWGVVLYAFDGQADDELTVQENDQVLITDYVSSDEWWTVEYQDGRSGIIPASYAMFHEDFEAQEAQEQEAERLRQEQEQQAAAAAAEEEEQQRAAAASAAAAAQQQHAHQQQQDKERVRQLEVDRRRKMQEETKQRELAAHKPSPHLAPAIASPLASSPRLVTSSPQQPISSPRRSDIPAPLPPSTPKKSPVMASPSAPPQPEGAKVRTWTDRTGAFKVDAQFLSIGNGKIRLHKVNGVKIDVPLQKMCAEDLKYIEQQTGQRLLDDKLDDHLPLAHFANNNAAGDGFHWFDYFAKINIPANHAMRYAASFQQEGLTEKDLDSLTHRRMKALGLLEQHVRRLEGYLEASTIDPPSDSEEAGASRRKGKKSVTFGSTTTIHDSDGFDADARQRQIDEDERFARQLQQEEDKQSPNRTHLQRRGTGRPTPSVSAPKDMNTEIMDKIKSQLSSQPLQPKPAAPSLPSRSSMAINTPPPTASSTPIAPTPSAPPPPPAAAASFASTPAPATAPAASGFQDDAWTNRPTNGPASTTWTSPAQPSAPSLPQQPQPPAMPARQRPTPQVSQTNAVNPQQLNQWLQPNTAASPSPQQQPVMQPMMQPPQQLQPQATGLMASPAQPMLPNPAFQAANPQLPFGQQPLQQPLYMQPQPATLAPTPAPLQAQPTGRTWMSPLTILLAMARFKSNPLGCSRRNSPPCSNQLNPNSHHFSLPKSLPR
ncbi:hypothetical protein DM01DRAFT_1184680 [Hesseltinella vesiculosa]|uniref:Actin cytoskeleton-regulatory complex protein SLA1 n=1 Tax=Hesseltinella vesiculosa TaxID=101127 RepID=A0A1X2GQM2_9FUNG|nr:hypothetical protein DM01DRAFT_1184680 [Hesseltinella vesiculosa]